MIQGVITLILVIDDKVSAASVNVGDKGTVVVYPTPDAINKYRSQDTKNSTLTAYSALSQKCKDIVDSILECALNNRNWDHLSLDTNERVTPVDDKDADVVEEVTNSVPEHQRAEPEPVKKPVNGRGKSSTMNDAVVPRVHHEFPVHRRNGLTRPFGEMGMVMLFKAMLSYYPSIAPGSVFVIVEGDAVHPDWPTMKNKTLLWMLERWRANKHTDESFLQNLQGVFDIGLYDKDLDQQWFCHIDHDNYLIVWTSF
jgi:hypothetical protein